MKSINLFELSKEDLILVIANMHDTISNWSQGHGLQKEESEILNIIGYECCQVTENYDLSQITNKSFKAEDWVVFIPEKAEGFNLKTDVWNKPFVLKIDHIGERGDLVFTTEEMILAGCKKLNEEGYHHVKTCSNSRECFRKATKEEIANRRTRRRTRNL
jgi:hypothetical protein